MKDTNIDFCKLKSAFTDDEIISIVEKGKNEGALHGAYLFSDILSKKITDQHERQAKFPLATRKKLIESLIEYFY